MFARVHPVVERVGQEKRSGACVAEQSPGLALEIVSDELLRIAHHHSKMARGVRDIVRAEESQVVGILGSERAPPDMLRTLAP